MANRKQLGQQRLGTPVMDAFGAVVDCVERERWPDFRREPVRFYYDRMVGNWLLRLMDTALSDEQLARVGAQQVYGLVLSLLRDMLRHNAALIRPEVPSAGWVDTLIGKAADSLGVPRASLADDGQPYELDDMANCGWARALSAPFGLVPEKLFACHSSIVTGVREEYA